ncbi:MAG: hypothetical protein MK108_10075 [Mariniblastus sp.]|nr:hypothetical protein [Mariniblastus sp.]
MNDPFNTKSVNRQLMREAKIGLVVVLLLGSFFVYVGYFRMGRFHTQLPDHIISAPVATNVGQQYYKNFLPDEPEKLSPAMTAGLQEKVRNRRVKPEVATKPRPVKDKPVATSPFQLPHALRQVGNQLSDALSKTDQGNDKNVEPASTRPMPPALRVADVTAGQGPIPAAKLKSANPNRQTEFDIVSSGLGGKPEPFAASDLNSNVESGKPKVVPEQAQPAKAEAPEARTAREIPVNERDQSRVVPAGGVGSAGPVSLASASSFDPSAGGVTIAKTETLDKRSVLADVGQQPVATPSDALGTSQPAEKSPVPESPGPAHLNGQPKEGTAFEEFEKHVVQEGEGYWSMAQMYLKDGRLFRALFEHNRGKHASYDDLPAGTQVEIPTSDYLVKHYPDHVPSDLKGLSSPGDRSQPGSWYVTHQGETLFDIAKQKYGQASRYLDILKANRDLLPGEAQHMTRLPAGLRLLLPN